MENVKKLLCLGNFNQALTLLCEKYVKEFDQFQKNIINQEIKDLISFPLVIELLSKDLLDRISTLIDQNIFPEGKSISFGWAEFPVILDSDSCIKRLNIESNTSEIVSFNCREADKTSLLKYRGTLLKEIQKNLRDPIDERIRDVTIINWGLTFSLFDKLIPEGTKYSDTEGSSIIIEGTSFLFAATIAFISKFFSLEVNPNYIFTGSFDSKGSSEYVNFIKQKTEIIKNERPKTEKIFVPSFSCFNESEQDLLKSDKLFVEVKNYLELIEKVFDKSLKEICKVSNTKRKMLGAARIVAQYLGRIQLKYLNKYFEKGTKDMVTTILHFKANNSTISYNYFPIEDIYFKNSEEPSEFVVFNGRIPNHYLGNYFTINRTSNCLFGIRKGRDSKEVIALGVPRGDELELVGSEFDFSEYLE